MVSATSSSVLISPTEVFPGPRAFKVEEAKLFFGREREAGQLNDLVQTYQDVLLYAQSGAGKTSLINARLIPHLGIENCYLARLGGELPPGVDPEEIPNIFVYNLIASTVTDASKMSAVRQATLEQHFQIPQDREQTFLILDQFEEIFTNYPERWSDRRPFFEQLRSLLRKNPTLHVLFAIREEYMAALEFYSDLLPNQFHIRYYLQRLRAEQATAAIVGPLSQSTLSIDNRHPANLAEKLVTSLRTVPVKTPKGVVTILGEFVEPLHLQVVCQNLVAQLNSGVIPTAKDQVANFTDVDHALSEFYKRAVTTTVEESKVEEGRVRRWFDHELITAAGTRGIVFQGECETAGLPNAAVNVLARANIIRGDNRGGAWWYELTHDRFIAPIRRSNEEWRQARGDAYQLGQQLLTRAEEWDKAGRLPEHLLNESELKEAQTWIKGPEAEQEGYDDKLEDLISASAEALQVKKEQQRILEMQAHSAQRFRNLALLLGVVCIAALLLLLWGYRQRREVESFRLAGGVLHLLRSAPEKSVLLAMHAVAAEPSPQNFEALNRSLHRLRLLHILTGHKDKVTAVAFSPTDHLLVTGSEDHTAKIWDTETWTLLHTLDFGPRTVRSIVFSTDGTRLFTVSNNEGESMLELWSPQTGEPAGQKRMGGWTMDAAYYPKAQVLATAELNVSETAVKTTIRFWDATDLSFRELAHWTDDNMVNAIAFDHVGSVLATADSDKIVRLWPYKACMAGHACKPMMELKGNSDKIMGIAFSPDNSYLASAGMDRSVRIWNHSGENKYTLPDAHSNTVFAVAFDPSGRLISASADGTAKVWDPFSGHQLANLSGHSQPVEDVAVSSDGRFVATASWDRTVRIWDVGGHKGFITDVAFSPDGKLLATASRDKTVKLWDSATVREIQTLQLDDQINSVVFNHEGTLLAAAAGKVAHVWDVGARKWSVQMSLRVEVNVVAFNPHTSELALGADSGSVILYEPKVGAHPRILGHNETGVSALAFSPDGKWAASAAGDDPILLWDANSSAGTPRCKITGDHEYVDAVAFSPDGQMLATGSLGGAVRLWNASNCAGLRSLAGHRNAVVELAFSPDGRSLASASWDGTVRLWDRFTGKEKTHFELDTAVDSVAFSPYGARLGIAAHDIVPQIYDLNAKDLLSQAHLRIKDLGATLQPDECLLYFDSKACPPMP